SISIRAVGLLKKRFVAHIAGAPTSTIGLRENWRSCRSCNDESNPKYNFFHRFLLSHLQEPLGTPFFCFGFAVPMQSCSTVQNAIMFHGTRCNGFVKKLAQNERLAVAP